jgi:hypothetical protein
MHLEFYHAAKGILTEFSMAQYLRIVNDKDSFVCCLACDPDETATQTQGCLMVIHLILSHGAEFDRLTELLLEGYAAVGE